MGGRHIAVMSHLGHVRELSTDKVRHAIHRLKQEAGVIIRSQSPVMRGINDDAKARGTGARGRGWQRLSHASPTLPAGVGRQVARGGAARHRPVLHVHGARHGRAGLL